MITTGGEGHFYWKPPVYYWYNHALVSDYNYNGQAGEDFDKDMQLPNIDFGTYVSGLNDVIVQTHEFNIYSTYTRSTGT